MRNTQAVFSYYSFFVCLFCTVVGKSFTTPLKFYLSHLAERCSSELDGTLHVQHVGKTCSSTEIALCIRGPEFLSPSVKTAGDTRLWSGSWEIPGLRRGALLEGCWTAGCPPWSWPSSLDWEGEANETTTFPRLVPDLRRDNRHITSFFVNLLEKLFFWCRIPLYNTVFPRLSRWYVLKITCNRWNL